MPKPKKPARKAASKKAQPKPTGRPSSFTQAVADVICERLSVGESLRSICADADMPGKSTVFRWLTENEPFRDQYARAREEQADHEFDGLCNLADEPPAQKVDGTVDPGWVQYQKLRIDTRKWAISKLAPKKYGDRIAAELTGKDGGPIETKDLSENDRARRLLFGMNVALDILAKEQKQE